LSIARCFSEARKAGHSLRPGKLFFGLATLAEGDDFGWVNGVAVDLHFDDFAALVDQVVDAASCFVLGIVETYCLVTSPPQSLRRGKVTAIFLPTRLLKGLSMLTPKTWVSAASSFARSAGSSASAWFNHR